MNIENLAQIKKLGTQMYQLEEKIAALQKVVDFATNEGHDIFIDLRCYTEFINDIPGNTLLPLINSYITNLTSKRDQIISELQTL